MLETICKIAELVHLELRNATNPIPKTATMFWQGYDIPNTNVVASKSMIPNAPETTPAGTYERACIRVEGRHLICGTGYAYEHKKPLDGAIEKYEKYVYWFVPDISSPPRR